MEIVIKPSLSIDEAYNELQKAAKEYGCMCWCDFNGVTMYSCETLDNFYKKLSAVQQEQQENRLPLTLNRYQTLAMTTCLPSCENDMYMLFGLVEEVGELAGKISKAIRKKEIAVKNNRIVWLDTKINAETAEKIKSELSDCCWFIAGIARQFGCTLEEVAQYNLDKLAKRKDSGTIVTHTDH